MFGEDDEPNPFLTPQRPRLKRPLRNGRPWKYPWPRLAVGDTFRVYDSNITTVMSAASQFVKRNQPDWKFKGKTQPDGSIIVERIQ